MCPLPPGKPETSCSVFDAYATCLIILARVCFKQHTREEWLVLGLRGTQSLKNLWVPLLPSTYSNCVSQVPTHTNSSFSTLLRWVHYLVLSEEKTHMWFMAPRYPVNDGELTVDICWLFFWDISTDSAGLPLPVGGRKAGPATVIKDTLAFFRASGWCWRDTAEQKNQGFSPANPANTITVGCNTQKGAEPRISKYWLPRLKVDHCGYLSLHRYRLLSKLLQQHRLLITKELPLISQMHWASDRHTQKQPSMHMRVSCTFSYQSFKRRNGLNGATLNASPSASFCSVPVSPSEPRRICSAGFHRPWRPRREERGSQGPQPAA